MGDKRSPAGITVYGCNGQNIPLPEWFDAAELTLPGNAIEFRGGVLALYDGSTDTGAFWTPGTAANGHAGRWLILQPIARDVFFECVAPLAASAEGGTAGGIQS